MANASPLPRDSRGTISFAPGKLEDPPPHQPYPLKTKVAHELHDGRYSTAISRLFRPEDLPNCKLCPECTACPITGLCLILARRYVSDADAPLYRFVSPPKLSFVPGV